MPEPLPPWHARSALKYVHAMKSTLCPMLPLGCRDSGKLQYPRRANGRCSLPGQVPPRGHGTQSHGLVVSSAQNPASPSHHTLSRSRWQPTTAARAGPSTELKPCQSRGGRTGGAKRSGASAVVAVPSLHWHALLVTALSTRRYLRVRSASTVCKPQPGPARIGSAVGLSLARVCAWSVHQ